MFANHQVISRQRSDDHGIFAAPGVIMCKGSRRIGTMTLPVLNEVPCTTRSDDKIL
jgi:hypothetical protein